MVSPILIPENQRQPFPRDVGKVSQTKTNAKACFYYEMSIHEAS